MAIISGVGSAASNLGMGTEWVILMVVMLGSLLFYTKSFIMGSVIQLLLSGGLFVVFYSLSWNAAPALICFFLSIILMVFALYGKYQEKGVGFV